MRNAPADGSVPFRGASAACAALASDWRMPTLDEVLCMSRCKDELPGVYLVGLYWTRAEYCFNNFWAADIDAGTAPATETSAMLHYRCVK
jgi:hypothetical protein